MPRTNDAQLEAFYALSGSLAALEGRLTQMVDSVRGLVINGVLFTGTVLLDGNGQYTCDFEVPYGAVAVAPSGTGTVTFVSDSQQVGAPSSGNGVHQVAAGKAAIFPVAGRALTLYGTAGQSVQLGVYDRPQTAATFGPTGTASGIVSTNDGDGATGFTGAQGVVSHTYIKAGGGVWNAVAAASNIGDGNAMAGNAATPLWIFNNGTWDRLRSASGLLGSGNLGQALGVGAGAYVVVSLNAAAAAAPGTALDNVLSRNSHTMQITGNGTGVTCNFEVSLDNATWVAVTPTAVPGGGGTVVGSAATTNGLYTITGAYRYVRANLTAVTTGAVTAKITSA